MKTQVKISLFLIYVVCLALFQSDLALAEELSLSSPQTDGTRLQNQSTPWAYVQSYTTETNPALFGNSVVGITMADDGRAILPIEGSNILNILSSSRTAIEAIAVPTEQNGFLYDFGGNNIGYLNHKIFYTIVGQKVYVYDEITGASRQIAERRNYYWGMAVGSRWLLLPAVNPSGSGVGVDVYNNSADLSSISLAKRLTSYGCSGDSCVLLDSGMVAAGSDPSNLYPSKAYLVGDNAYFIRGSYWGGQPTGGFYTVNLTTSQVITYTAANITGFDSAGPADMYYDPYTGETWFSKFEVPSGLYRINSALTSASLIRSGRSFIWSSTPDYLLTSDFDENNYRTLINIRVINKNTGQEFVYSSDSSPALLSSRIRAAAYRPDTDEVYVVTDLGLSVLSHIPTYSISGRVMDDNSISAAGVQISDSKGHSAISDASGNYTLSGLAAGTYTLTPSKNGYTFAPTSRANITVPPDATDKDFIIRTVPAPFLDIPVNYSNFAQALQGNQGTSPGLVNSWLDHFKPNYSKDTFLWRWDGCKKNDADDRAGDTWYDGHSGIDFQKKQQDDPVYASASGIVRDLNRNWPTSVGIRGSTYGNYVLIEHGNGYATLYGHMRSIESWVSIGTNITNPRAQRIAIIGGTGGFEEHLHFGLYYDANGNGTWEETAGGYSEAVDPYSYRFVQGCNGHKNDPNPWNITSPYLWKQLVITDNPVGNSGAQLTTPAGNKNANIPSGALPSTLTVQFGDAPPVAGASAQLRTLGQSFLLQVLEWLTGGSSSNAPTRATATSSFNQPVTVQVNYSDSDTQHFDANQLKIYRWDATGNAWVALQTTVDANQKTATAQTTETGSFDLQAPLKCPSDTAEIDDDYYAAKGITPDGISVDRIFDIPTDEDWIKFDATAGQQYVIQTLTLALGVDTQLEVYDLDGVTLLTSDDNSGGAKTSRVVWQAPQAATYFVRVRQVSGSINGCNATYRIRVSPLKATSTTLGSSTNPSTVGRPVTFGSTVSSAGGTPTGVVTFKDGTTTLGNRALDGNGQASLTTSSLSVGSHSITVNYVGANEFGGSTSTLVQVVNEPTTVTVENQDTAIQYNSWRGVSDASANGGTYRVSNSKNDTVTFKFTGKSIKWISLKGPDQGKAQVKIDGVDKGTLDLYSASTQYRFTKTFKNLGSGKHTLIIKVLGTKNPSATDTKVAVDGFIVGSKISQEDAPALRYNKWIGKADANASGGSYRFAKKPSASAKFTFTGTSVDWITTKGPSYGIAQVLIDGVSKGNVDLYAPTQQWQFAISYANLSNGQHIIEIKPLGTKNANSSATSVIIDAFRGPFTAIAN